MGYMLRRKYYFSQKLTERRQFKIYGKQILQYHLTDFDSWYSGRFGEGAFFNTFLQSHTYFIVMHTVILELLNVTYILLWFNSISSASSFYVHRKYFTGRGGGGIFRVFCQS